MLAGKVSLFDIDDLELLVREFLNDWLRRRGAYLNGFEYEDLLQHCLMHAWEAASKREPGRGWSASGLSFRSASTAPSRRRSVTARIVSGLASSELSPAAAETAKTVGQLLVWGWSIEEAADKLGLSSADVEQQLAELAAELEELAGVERTVRRFVRCGRVSPRRTREMCDPCFRTRLCRGCGELRVIPRGFLWPN